MAAFGNTCWIELNPVWYLLEDQVGRRSDEDYSDLFLRVRRFFAVSGATPPSQDSTTTIYVGFAWEGLKVGSKLDHQLLLNLAGLAAPYLVQGPLLPVAEDWTTVNYNCVVQRFGLSDGLTTAPFAGPIAGSSILQHLCLLPSTQNVFHPPGVGVSATDADEYWAAAPTAQGVGGFAIAIRHNGFLRNNPAHPSWAADTTNFEVLLSYINLGIAVRVPATGSVFLPNVPVADNHPLFADRGGWATHLAELSDHDASSLAWKPTPKRTAVAPQMYGTGVQLVAQLTTGLDPVAFKSPTACLTAQPAGTSADFSTLVSTVYPTSGC